MEYLLLTIIILALQLILYHHLKLPTSTEKLSIKGIHVMQMLFYNVWRFVVHLQSCGPPIIKLNQLFIFHLKNNVSVTFSKVSDWSINSILCSYLVQFLSLDPKNRKTSPLKKFFYFCEMEFSGSNIKEFLMFQETETLKKLHVLQEVTFQAGKNKKIHLEKNFLYFTKWNFLALILKKFRKQKPRKKFLLFQEIEPFSRPPQNLSYFRK